MGDDEILNTANVVPGLNIYAYNVWKNNRKAFSLSIVFR